MSQFEHYLQQFLLYSINLCMNIVFCFHIPDVMDNKFSIRLICSKAEETIFCKVGNTQICKTRRSFVLRALTEILLFVCCTTPKSSREHTIITCGFLDTIVQCEKRAVIVQPTILIPKYDYTSTPFSF